MPNEEPETLHGSTISWNFLSVAESNLASERCLGGRRVAVDSALNLGGMMRVRERKLAIALSAPPWARSGITLIKS
jgi:hypothetical protein